MLKLQYMEKEELKEKLLEMENDEVVFKIFDVPFKLAAHFGATVSDIFSLALDSKDTELIKSWNKYINKVKTKALSNAIDNKNHQLTNRLLEESGVLESDKEGIGDFELVIEIDGEIYKE